MPEGRRLPDSSLPGLRIPRCIQGQLHGEPGARRRNAGERRSSPASLAAREVWFPSRGCGGCSCSSASPKPGGGCRSTRRRLSWPRGFSQPLPRDAPAPGSSSVRWPCRGAPGPGAEQVGWSQGWSQRRLLQPCTGQHRGFSAPEPGAGDRPVMHGAVVTVARAFVRRRRRFLGPAAAHCALRGGSGLAPPRAGRSHGHGARGWGALLLCPRGALLARGCGGSGGGDARTRQQLRPGRGESGLCHRAVPGAGGLRVSSPRQGRRAGLRHRSCAAGGPRNPPGDPCWSLCSCARLGRPFGVQLLGETPPPPASP